MPYIYKITSPSNRVYVGSTKNVEYRFKQYKSLKCKQQTILYRSFLKYGVENHKFEIIEECSIDCMLQKESYWGNIFNCLNSEIGLNCNLPKVSDTIPCRSEETKNKISIALLGKKRTQEQKERMKIASANMSKEKVDIINKSKIGRRYTGSGKLILNLETGIFYNSGVEASKSTNLNKRTFLNKMNPKQLNKPFSNFIYC